MKLKRLGITQRVELFKAYGERRDCLDRRWSALALEVGFMPIPLPNIAAEIVPELLDVLQLDAVILSGGNSIAKLDPTASDASLERDAFEVALVKEAIHRLLPILGVCRGLQMLNIHFGGQLSHIEGHVRSYHRVVTVPEFSGFVPNYINSYHDWAIMPDQLADQLNPIVRDIDGNIEGFAHRSKSVTGIMWHPEREHPFRQQDIELLRKLLS